MAKKEVAKKGKEDTDKTASKFSTLGFINETKDELAKVVWPSRQQLLSESVAVILMVALVAIVIYLVDNLFGWGASIVFK